MITRNRKSVLSTVTPAAGGTQSNELQAAIKSVTSSTTVGAVFLYSTKDDSDGGAWRKKCKGLSWFDEPTLPAGTATNQWNSTTRSARSEFPAMALIVADTSAGVSVYDLDDPAMPLWMTFTLNTSYWHSYAASSVYALNGVLCIGQTPYDLVRVNFPDDNGILYAAAAYQKMSIGNIADRNTTGWHANSVGSGLVDRNVNDVAMTVLEGAEIGALGLPIPTVAVGTAGGCSVILANGTVNSSNSTDAVAKVLFANDSLWWARGISTYTVRQTRVSALFSASFGVIAEKYSSTVPALLGTHTSSTYSLADGAFGNASGLTVFAENTGNDAESMVSHITSTYNTGYMVGDIRGAWLAADRTADRSVKANTLTLNQASGSDTITAAAVATGAELYGYSNFKASNYLSQAYDADFDFGTGDFSVMFWFKTDQVGDQGVVYRGPSSFVGADPADGFNIWLYSTYIKVNVNGTYNQANQQGANVWQHAVLNRRGGYLYLYINGVSSTPVASVTNTTSTSNILAIGRGNYTYTGCNLALMRISATAPTPSQIKAIFDEEKVLFSSGAKCLLAANQVNDLAYDKTSGLLHVASESTASSKSFRGLEAVESLTSDGSLGLAASKPLDYITASGGVVAGVGGETADADTSGCGVNLPALDVRAELNEGESKLPDDGKLHFSGITTSNGGDVIAHIPIAEEENVTVNAHVTAKGYGADLGTHYANYILTEQFYRAAGGDVTSAVAETSIVSQESAAGLDATLGVDTSADTAKITVTGDASDRVVWTASVEVIRDAEKSYER